MSTYICELLFIIIVPWKPKSAYDNAWRLGVSATDSGSEKETPLDNNNTTIKLKSTRRTNSNALVC